jgi:hypothetical protein
LASALAAAPLRARLPAGDSPPSGPPSAARLPLAARAPLLDERAPRGTCAAGASVSMLPRFQ